MSTTRHTRKSLADAMDNATVDLGTSLAENRKKAKSRSKSIGPGGLDGTGLKSGTGNRRQSLAVPSRPPPRSILKPTIPLLPEIPPHKPKPKKVSGGTENLMNAFSNSDSNGSSSSSGTKVALRTEEEQQAAAREREERERAELEKEIKDRREARRKSLANRRVSFAAEATLHTFQEIDFPQDSTTSTDSTRRASQIAPPEPQHAGSDASEAPSTPPEQVEDIVAESPADQRQLHQKKQRRSSAPHSILDNHDADDASTVYDSDSDHGDGVAETQEEASASDSDSDNDGTMVTVDAEEMTSVSLASNRLGSDADMDTTSSIDEALRLAAQRKHDQEREPDEDEEVIVGFAGWGKKANNTPAIAANDQENIIPESSVESSPMKSSPMKDVDDGTEMNMDMDMDMTQSVGGIIRPEPNTPEEDDAEDMSMDVTRVFGAILSQPPQAAAEDSTVGDDSMDLTMPLGAIRSGDGAVADDENVDEDMSMELTTIMGGVLSTKNKSSARRSLRQATLSKNAAEDDRDSPMDMTMDMTVAAGRILPVNDDEGDDEGDATMGMDMTMAVGGIIKPVSPPKTRSDAKKLMEQEADQPEPTLTSDSIPPKSPLKSPPKQKKSNATPETQSPNKSVFHGGGLRRSNGPLFPTKTPKSPLKKTDMTPTKSTTPSSQPAQPSSRQSSPSRIPVADAGRTPSPSPKRQASPQARTTPQPSKSPAKHLSVFQHNTLTGTSTPRVVLTPQRPRLSGVGIDRPGLGSPRVSEIFDRRGSIGDTAISFVPGQTKEKRKAVAFQDPRSMEEEIDKERREAEDAESGRRILERETDGAQDDRDATLNLKELISGLSPKKPTFRGRKSLHVGSARGLLGKRPVELEDDEDAEENDGIKRLKGHQGSPVKNVRLQQPPTKAETTGRATRSSRRTLEEADANAITPTTTQSPEKQSANATTPKGQGRYRNVEDDEPTAAVNFDATPSANLAALQANDDEDKIHLQDFLNMTSIRFMELTTTKRRHTVAPSAPKDNASEDNKEEDISFEKCVVAGACTVPMLELYQHSCRELKKYISEGRRIVREIETETFEENPPLFREYISATPDFKILMDNQFKNVKTHARLLSKAMWYEWRMKLQDGLKEGLIKIAEGMVVDETLLDKEQKLLSSVLPGLVKHFAALEREHENLEAIASELEDCDPEELEAARSDLLAVDEDTAAKMQEIAELQQQLKATEESVSHLTEQKQLCHTDIKEAEKIREDCRGWNTTEISSLRWKVINIEAAHGWSVTGVVGTTVSMTYQREIELVFDISSFQEGQQNSRIDLWYIAGNRECNAVPSTTEKEFFLQCTRDYVRSLPQSQTKLSLILGVVRATWDRANAVANHVRLLNVTFPSQVTKTSDSSIAIKSSLLLTPLQTKVDVVIGLHSAAVADGVEFTLSPHATVVYGEQFNAPKMGEFLATRIGNHVLTKAEKEVEPWSNIVMELHARLLARGRK